MARRTFRYSSTVKMPPPSLTPERAKVAEFYSAGSGTIPPLPWQTFPPPFSTPEGKKELLGFTDGARESAQDWRELLLDLQNRGLTVAPELAVADGALGFWKALGELWPTTREQRCWVHKTANVLNKLPKSSRKPSG